MKELEKKDDTRSATGMRKQRPTEKVTRFAKLLVKQISFYIIQSLSVAYPREGIGGPDPPLFKQKILEIFPKKQ